MAGEPVKLGSAALSRYIFQDGSTITISDSGIQESSIKAIWPDGATVMNNIPAAGATFDSIFANSYLPADFKLDRTKDGSVQVEYSKGGAATVTFSFKRPDPNASGQDASRKLSVDSAITYKSLNSYLGINFLPPYHVAVPEPVVTVRYNSLAPSLLVSPYAYPGSAATIGFPIVPPVINIFFPGALIGTPAASVQIPFAYASPIWERTGMKWEPIADESFFDVTETWRRPYFNIYGGDIT